MHGLTASDVACPSTLTFRRVAFLASASLFSPSGGQQFSSSALDDELPPDCVLKVVRETSSNDITR
jgi:hypothetical protein